VIASASSATFEHQSLAPPRRFAVHGPAVEIDCAVPAVAVEIERVLGPFAVAGWPEGFTSVGGTVREYDTAQVVRHLSPAARPVPAPRSLDLAELYEDAERYWLVDERWGMVEVNFLKSTWRSWVLPRPQLDPVRCAEMAVLWPLAQLLRQRGLHLLPAASAVRNGFAFLLLCPFGPGPELTALARAGYRIIGQRWTAVREEDGRLALLHLPGRIERATGAIAPAPRPPGAAASAAEPTDPDGARADARWLDLNAQFPGTAQHHAFCDAVLVADAVRRPHARVRELEPADALAALRQAWPIADLHPNRRHSALPARLAQQCRCAEVQLSRYSAELLELLDGIRVGEREPQVA
jgi:hypothetical protein